MRKKLEEFNLVRQDINRLYIYLKDNDEMLLKKLEQLNFKYAGTLKNELGRHSQNIIVYYYDDK